MEVIKILGIEDYRENWEEIAKAGKYIGKYTGIYKVFFNEKNQIKTKKVCDCKGFTRRGRYFVFDEKVALYHIEWIEREKSC